MYINNILSPLVFDGMGENLEPFDDCLCKILSEVIIEGEVFPSMYLDEQLTCGRIL